MNVVFPDANKTLSFLAGLGPHISPELGSTEQPGCISTSLGSTGAVSWGPWQWVSQQSCCHREWHHLTTT